MHVVRTSGSSHYSFAFRWMFAAVFWPSLPWNGMQESHKKANKRPSPVSSETERHARTNRET